MAWYAVWYINNPDHINYGKVGGFIIDSTESSDDEFESDIPLCKDTEEEILNCVSNYDLYKCGLIDIIEI